MASKVQTIFELSEDTVRSLSNANEWRDFLKTASWQYKYPFQDQVLIYSVITPHLKRTVLLMSMTIYGIS